MTRKINREGVAGYIEDLSLFYRAFAIRGEAEE